MARINWCKHIDEHSRSGLSVAAYCKKHRISPSSFYLARKKARELEAFTPVVVKETSENAIHLEVSLALAKGGLVEFRGLTNDKALLSALVAGVWL